MHEFVLTNTYKLLLLSVLIFFIIYVLVKKYLINICDPLFQLIINSSISVSTLLLINPGIDNINIIYYFIASYAIIFILINLFPRKFKHYRTNNFIYIKTNDIVFIYLISVISGIFIMYNFIITGLNYEERGLLLKENRIIEIIRITSTSIVAFSLGFIRDYKKILVYIIPLLIINLFTGSKGFLINIISNLIIGRTLSSNFNINFLKLLLIGLFFYFSIYLIYFLQSRENINLDIFYRILASGDLYFHGIEELQINSLNGLYNIFTYLLHPITNIFGIRLYEYSLGNEIQGQLSGNYNTGGTNAGFLFLSYISFNYKILIFFMATLWSFLFILSRIWALNLLIKIKSQCNNKYNICFIVLIYNLLTIPIIIFFDVGVGIQQLLGGLIILLTLIILKLIYYGIKK